MQSRSTNQSVLEDILKQSLQIVYVNWQWRLVCLHFKISEVAKTTGTFSTVDVHTARLIKKDKISAFTDCYITILILNSNARQNTSHYVTIYVKKLLIFFFIFFCFSHLFIIIHFLIFAPSESKKWETFSASLSCEWFWTRFCKFRILITFIIIIIIHNRPSCGTVCIIW